MLEDNIKNLIKILEESNIEEMEVSTFWGKQRIRIRKNILPQYDSNLEIINNEPQIIKTDKGEQSQITDPDVIPEPIVPKIPDLKSIPLNDEGKISVKAPLVGTFYRSLKPGDPPFISEGDIIEKGQIICIIEAMKIFNEIESDISGKVVSIIVKDSTPVEYDQDLIFISTE